MTPEQRAAVVSALEAAVASLRAVQAVLASCTPDPAPAGPPAWWNELGLDDPEGRD